jgi:hypothetical protein
LSCGRGILPFPRFLGGSDKDPKESWSHSHSREVSLGRNQGEMLLGTMVPVGGRLRGSEGTKGSYSTSKSKGPLTKPLPPLILLKEGKSGGDRK